jgi:hypothetical protein
LETVRTYFRVDRREIAFLRFIFEGYDGVAFVSTVDRQAGLVRICTAPGCEKEVAGILEALSAELLIEACAPGPSGDP